MQTVGKHAQFPADDKMEAWIDPRSWNGLHSHLDPELAERIVTGSTPEKNIASLRRFVVKPTRFGNMFLAGDAAHIVAPAGAKGLHLAASDMKCLANAFTRFYAEENAAGIDSGSQRALACIWKAERAPG